MNGTEDMTVRAERPGRRGVGVNSPSSSITRLGIVGCGNIADRYVEGVRRFPTLEIVGCADLVHERAQALAARHGLRGYRTIEELMADDTIDIVINITPPRAHATVSAAAITAGHHVYVEKPMAAAFQEAVEMHDAARAAGRRLGVAPDTFLGSANQTARRAIDDGLIGRPIGVSAFVKHSRMETWHPDPTFFFQPGGGPVLDLGPYYITALVNLLGPVGTVAGLSRTGAPVRRVTAPNRLVEEVEVNVKTHSTAVLEFSSGVLGTVMMSFEVWDTALPCIEIYGEEGTLTLPDPNTYDGEVSVRRHGETDWSVLEPVFAPAGPPGPAQMLRGHGVADLAASLSGNPLRTSPELATHVLEVLEAIETTAPDKKFTHITSTCNRPEPLERTLL